jgi:hypothetical protein
MTEQISVIFLFITLFILIGIIILICRYAYQIVNEPKIQKRMRRLRKPVQPWVTVLIHSQANDTDVEGSVKSLLKSYYHNFDIVIVKDSSRDAVKALNKGYQKSQKGEVVLSLRAGTIVSPWFLKRTVALKGERKKLQLRIPETASIKSFAEIILSLESIFWHKAYSVQVSDAKNIAPVKKRIHIEWVMLFIFISVIVTSFALREPSIIWYSWLLVTGYLFAIIWLSDEKEKTKFQLSFSAISALFLLPVASIIMRFSQLHSRN